MNRRFIKVNELLLQQLSKMIQQEFSEEFSIITVNNVAVSADLSWAKVRLGIINTENSATILDKVCQKEFEFRGRLIKILDLKKIPRLQFSVDQSNKDVSRMQKIFDKINNE